MYRALGLILVIVFSLLAIPAATADDYPNKSVRIIVPYPPGGPTDIISRHIAKRLSDELGKQFIVENKGGANGVLGTQLVAMAKPDGYTLLFDPSGPLASGLALYKDIPYDVNRDFTAISNAAVSSIVLVASPSFPASTYQEFITIAKSKPDGVTAELNTIGSIHHLLTALLRERTGAHLLLVPYKGSGPAIIDLVGGQVDVGFESVPGVLSFIKSGKLRAYAVATPNRVNSLPDVPTFKELGMPEFVAEPWWAILGPAGMPKDVVDKLSAALQRIAKIPEVKEQFARQGMVPDWMSPADTTAFLRNEVARWAKIAKETGAKTE